jgi:hypothetical protein
MGNAQIVSSYSNNTDINPVAFTITIYSPDTQTYKNTLPLNFTVYWTRYPSFDFPIPPAPKVNVAYSYAIDGNSAVFVVSNQSSNDIVGYSNFTVNPTFSYFLNIANLTNGYHKIVITTGLYFDDDLVYGASSSHVQFLVGTPKPTPTPTLTPTPVPTSTLTPTPTVPEFSWLIILPLFISILFITISFRKRKLSDGYD